MAAGIFHGMIGNSVLMRRLFDLITKLADDDQETVLIQGESGTGKELVAKAIHAYSPRAAKNFVPVNCAAIPDELLESELFGYSKGAFTGAGTAKVGRVQYADKGSLFLDEIGDMKPVLQAKLLRVLQEREFEPVGALKPISVDIRVIAATHCNLEQMVEEGRFREDLYYRLSVVPLVIPPLRDRKEDLPFLLDHFIKTTGNKRTKPLLGFDRNAMQALLSCDWRGNVRELQNLVQHMRVLYGGEIVAFNDLPEKYQVDFKEDINENFNVSATENEPPPPCANRPQELTSSVYPDLPPVTTPAAVGFSAEEGVDFKAMVNDFESQLILQALKMTRGNKKEAAEILNLKRTTLMEKIKKKQLQDAWQDY